MYKITYKKFWFIFTMLFLFSILFGLLLKNNSFDYKFMSVFQRYNVFLKNDISFFIVKFISFLGNPEMYFIAGIPIAIFLIYNKEFHILKTLLIAVLLSFLFNELMKVVVKRIRPIDFWHIYAQGFSFPSGHSMVGVSFYFTLGAIIFDKTNNKSYLNCFRILALVIAFTRVILGVHWLSDVIIGSILGYICHVVSMRFYFKFRRN